MVDLKYISNSALFELKGSIRKNLDRYIGEGFNDFVGLPSWDISLGIEYDSGMLGTLDVTQQQNIVQIDLTNSKIVGQALKNLSPSMANEELIWARLTHTDAFEYSKARWLNGLKGDDLAESIETHMFASTQTMIRDDNALSRLWWNYHIARHCMPDDIDRALNLILKTADIRSNFVERIWMSSRREIAGAILRAMDSNPWITDAEQNFREFMKLLNRQGGGIVFEALNENDIDTFIADCVERSKSLMDAA